MKITAFLTLPNLSGQTINSQLGKKAKRNNLEKEKDNGK
jgi:hypothetical protein